MYSRIKPIFDFIGSIILIVVLFPILLGVFCIQFIYFKNPIYVQKRPGLNEKVYKIYKFRTLKVEGDDESITNFGRIIRKTSIDELPQLINIIRGDMSFIGPRPLLIQYLNHYSERQSLRHNVKPGITGLAQVKGRNKLSWTDSLEFDVQYVESLSFSLDLKITLKTITQLFKFSEVGSVNEKNRDPFI